MPVPLTHSNFFKFLIRYLFADELRQQRKHELSPHEPDELHEPDEWLQPKVSDSCWPMNFSLFPVMAHKTIKQSQICQINNIFDKNEFM